MKILAIDPGAKESGYVVFDTSEQRPEKSGHIPNEAMLLICRNYQKDQPIAIEQIRGYGIVAGDDTFDTCQWSGRFEEAHKIHGGSVFMVPRKDVKRHLCGNTTCRDTHIRQALIDKYGPVGSKKSPGPLFGITSHCWAALAIAITCESKLEGSF